MWGQVNGWEEGNEARDRREKKNVLKLNERK
jgi:hypothetical protein